MNLIRFAVEKFYLTIIELKATAKFLFSKSPKRPCHYRELFINTNGDVFPCCLTWGRKSMKIGNVCDVDLQQKIDSFRRICSCARYRLRHQLTGESKKYLLMNLELSLLCQGSCIMCCVDAPSWRGSYDLYDKLEKLISENTPEELLVQGGEILVQTKSLTWLQHIRKTFPLMRISLITNGCVAAEVAEAYKDVFDRITVSFVGFQPETYSKVMGLDLGKTLRFVDKLLEIGRARIFLKFLITPVNIHETPLFLAWAIEKRPERIAISDANCTEYIRMGTSDSYWQKIMDRAAVDVHGTLLEVAGRLDEKAITFSIDQGARKLLRIDDVFIKQNNLKKYIDWT